VSQIIKTHIYNDNTFFDSYLKTTTEKLHFINCFLKKSQNKHIDSILDLGSFDGSLFLRLIIELLNNNFSIKNLSAVEPSLIPINKMKEAILHSETLSKIQWNIHNEPMEIFLSNHTQLYDWVIASHSLYWMNDLDWILNKILSLSKNGVIVIRDNSLLYALESKYRPLMTQKKKKQYSSQNIIDFFDQNNIPYLVDKFEASMTIPEINSIEFKNLVGFLLDLTLVELDEGLFPSIYSDMNIAHNKTSYSIDMIWFGDVLKI